MKAQHDPRRLDETRANAKAQRRANAMAQRRATKRKVRCGLLVSALAVTMAYGQQSSPPTPSPAEVDAVFARFDQSSTPGCSLGVYRDGEMTYEHGYGMADLGHGVPITPATVFYIGSTAKQFTAFAIAMLAERGSLSLTDSVRKHIPELPDWAESIRIEHLVHHTSGLRDYLGLWSMSGRSFADEIPLEHAIDLIARQRSLNFPPGTEWSYTNSGYVLLAEIVGRVTGTSLRQFMHDEAFAPLGMESTLFYDDNGEIVADRANGYQPDGVGGYRLFRTSYALVGDGGLLTTVTDAADVERYLGRYSPQPGLLIDVIMLGDALALQPPGGAPALPLTATSDTTFSTAALPDAVRFSVDEQGEPSLLIEGIGQSEPAPRLPPLPALSDDDLADYAGRYTSAELDTWFEIRAVEGLELRRRYQAWERLQPIAPDRFMGPSGEMRFNRDGEGRVAGFEMGAARVRGVLFVRQGSDVIVAQ